MISRLDSVQSFLADKGFTLVPDIPEYADENSCDWLIVPLSEEAASEMTDEMRLSLYSLPYAVFTVAGLASQTPNNDKDDASEAVEALASDWRKAS